MVYDYHFGIFKMFLILRCILRATYIYLYLICSVISGNPVWCYLGVAEQWRQFFRVVNVIFIRQFSKLSGYTISQFEKLWYKWCVAWGPAMSHLGRWFLHVSLEVMQQQSRFKVCNILYLLVISILLSCCLHSTNHKKTKGKEYIHVTISYIHYKHRGDQQISNNVTLDQPPHILLVHIF